MACSLSQEKGCFSLSEEKGFVFCQREKVLLSIRGKRFCNLSEEKTLREDHVPYMLSTLQKEMYKRDMAKHNLLNDRFNDKKHEIFRKQRSKTGLMWKQAIKTLLFKCKPGENQRLFWFYWLLYI